MVLTIFLKRFKKKFQLNLPPSETLQDIFSKIENYTLDIDNNVYTFSINNIEYILDKLLNMGINIKEVDKLEDHFSEKCVLFFKVIDEHVAIVCPFKSSVRELIRSLNGRYDNETAYWYVAKEKLNDLLMGLDNLDIKYQSPETLPPIKKPDLEASVRKDELLEKVQVKVNRMEKHLSDFFKEVQGKSFDFISGTWSFSINEYQRIIDYMKQKNIKINYFETAFPVKKGKLIKSNTLAVDESDASNTTITISSDSETDEVKQKRKKFIKKK